MTGIFGNNGFWFAVGVVVGLAIEFLGTFFIDWWRRPQLKVSLEGLWPVITVATIPSSGDWIGEVWPPTQPVMVKAYRFRVINDGRRAAENVAGTLEFDNIERRICWYEGNVPNITINAYDRSYLDVHGVLLSAQNDPTNDVVMPTERGWNNLEPRTLTAPLGVRLRMTAANARLARTEFFIDPAQGCRPVSR